MSKRETNMRIGALIVAAGRGTRAGGPRPKQWQTIAGQRVLDWTLGRFAAHPAIDEIALVLNEADLHETMPALPGLRGALHICKGGVTRAASVKAGLTALQELGLTHVLIHDAARCTLPASVIDGVIEALQTSPGAAPALPVTDALWTGTETGGKVTGTHPRDGLFRAQTPQGFDLAAISAAHAAYSGDAADDVEVARAAGLAVTITPGHEDNLKITTPADFARAGALLEKSMDIRLGNGFDVHAFEPGDHAQLCGVRVPHTKALKGHSDADVGLHAITDAIYGALGDGDIGQHFPPSEAKWKGAASDIFLKHAAARAAERSFSISNVDCTLICERPKIGPHAAAMREEVARILGIAPERVSVKATTSEQLGFTGREEGIAALATATLVKP